MVKHIVMFKLSERTPENLENVVQALRGMEGKVEVLRFIEVGINFSESDRSYDVVLTTHFDDKESLSIYAAHENHVPVAKLMRSLCSHSVVVDYEMDS